MNMKTRIELEQGARERIMQVIDQREFSKIDSALITEIEDELNISISLSDIESAKGMDEFIEMIVDIYIVVIEAIINLTN